METLIQQLNAICEEFPFETSWHVKDLRSGAMADRNGAVVVPSASTRKIAILMTALKQVQEGRFALDQRIDLDEQYRNTISGCFQFFLAGQTARFHDALVMMIIVSDNISTGTICDLIGLDAVNELCAAIGMTGTAHRHQFPVPGLAYDHPVEFTNATTPNDQGLLLDLILQGTQDAAAAARLGCTPELCRLALDILSWQRLRNRLPALLPVGTKVAHKTGLGARNHNDVGIIYRDNAPRFILAAYTDWVPVTMPDGFPGHWGATQVISRLSRACWDALQ